MEKKPVNPGLLARLTQSMKQAFGQTPETSWMGPGEPLQPAPQAQAEVRGRQWDYAPGLNISTATRQTALTSYDQLRVLADSYDLVRLVIETRKDLLCAAGWHIKPRDVKKKADKRCEELKKFLASPDKEHDWAQWLRMLLEEMMVTDAATVYPRKTVGGAPYAMELIDGTTIRRVIDVDGRTPLPPNPAYQQIIKGVVVGDFTREELIYAVRNPRVHKLYGFGPVEQIIMTVNIALRRQVSQLAYFTAGNVPDALASVPKEWTGQDIKEFQDYWDNLLAGDVQGKRKLKFIPDGTQFKQTTQPPLKDEFDEWLARVVCYAFGVSPQPFIKENNRSTSETAQKAAIAEGLAPSKQWVKNLIDRIIVTQFGYADLEFGWDEYVEVQPLIQAQIDQIYVAAGVMTVNEVRERLGMEDLPPEDLPPKPGAAPRPTETELSDTTHSGGLAEGENQSMTNKEQKK